MYTKQGARLGGVSARQGGTVRPESAMAGTYERPKLDQLSDETEAKIRRNVCDF